MQSKIFLLSIPWHLPITEITRDSISEFDAYSDEEYETGGRYRRGHGHGAPHRRRR